jgi:hypothetical protein
VKKNATLNLLRIAAIIVALAGSVGSLFYTLHAGRNNKSVLLVMLFTGWVLSPFLVLLVATVLSKRRQVNTRITLYCMVLVITIGCLVAYSGILTPPGTKPAFVFLVAPFLSWLIMAVVILGAAARARKAKGV